MAAAIKILSLMGDGIGPEICRSALAILHSVNGAFDLGLIFEEAEIGWNAYHRHGSTFPARVLEAAKSADGIILGPVSHNEYPKAEKGGLNPSGELRRQLDLYANIRPARSRAGIPSKVGKPLDLVIVRENTEGFYADRSMFSGSGELRPTADLALAVRKVSRSASTRIAEAGFGLALARRKKVTVVHKANVLHVSDGLFLECTREVAASHPEVTYEEQLMDSMAALLVRDPGQFDVVVTTNMFGDILSDEASEISGSLGLAGSLNRGARHAVAQAQHGSAPDLAGKDKANPTSMILSCAMLLDWLGHVRSDEKLVRTGIMLEAAIDELLSSPGERTLDLGGTVGTSVFTQRVITTLQKARPPL
jgi:isocitrate/isopropylmalate dehydrogenase